MLYKDFSEMLSLNDICRILNIGKNTAYRLLANQEIIGFKIGHVWKIPKANLETYISQQCQK
jgi:excisionase family DNA binding protein